MAHIELAVTAKVIRQVQAAGMNQRQIAIKDASTDMLEKIGTARKDSLVLITVVPGIELTVGDTGAIWYTHQANLAQQESFIALYDSLAEKPDHPMRFKSN